MISGLSEWFWQERLWFPEGLGWADLEDRDGRVYAKARDLWVALPIALIFLIIRQIFERSVHLPLCLTPYLSLWLLIQTFASSIFTHFFLSVHLSSWLLFLSFLLQSAHRLSHPLTSNYIISLECCFHLLLFFSQQLFNIPYVVPYFIISKALFPQVTHIVSHTSTVFLFPVNLLEIRHYQVHLCFIANARELSSSLLFCYSCLPPSYWAVNYNMTLTNSVNNSIILFTYCI